jgi:CheY-like chemotaxis protein
MNQSASFNPQDIIILIVDDLKPNVKLLNFILKANEYQTSLALSGKQALERLNVLTPDLILLDLMMPDMSGLEVCRQIKSQDKYRNIPIIFLTASEEKSDFQEAYKLGAADYVTKPFRKEELLSKINTQLTLMAQSKYISQLEAQILELRTQN